MIKNAGLMRLTLGQKQKNKTIMHSISIVQLKTHSIFS